MQKHSCPVCSSEETGLFTKVSGYNYYQCNGCALFFIDPEVLHAMDQGKFLVKYNHNYWGEELKAARERSWGTTLARVAEVFLYARIPIRKFMDIGSGPGYILDALQHHLPSAHKIFHAAELFPPDEEYCTKNENFHRGSLRNIPFKFDAGCCIEVLEHLTPNMARDLFSDVAEKSLPNSIYIFNTGLSEYIRYEDPGYLDPLVRGHVIGWSLNALKHMAEPLGFSIQSIPGKTWAFIAEYQPDHGFDNPADERIWSALPENKVTLHDAQTGNLMYILGLETARAYKPIPQPTVHVQEVLQEMNNQ